MIIVTMIHNQVALLPSSILLFNLIWFISMIHFSKEDFATEVLTEVVQAHTTAHFRFDFYLHKL
jgi:hypothetical protein